MRELCVIKNWWPSPTVLAWPDKFNELPTLLAPIAGHLDKCWWYLGGQGFKVRNRALTNEVDQFVTAGGKAGRPGFFSRFGDGLSVDWTTFFAVDGDDPDRIFGSFDLIENTWFEKPASVPSEVCVAVRGVDAAYWDILFRDEWMWAAVMDHVSKNRQLVVEEGCRSSF